MFLFNKRVLRFFRKDGHSWRKKKDGRTVGEAHERLKVTELVLLILQMTLFRNIWFIFHMDRINHPRVCIWCSSRVSLTVLQWNENSNLPFMFRLEMLKPWTVIMHMESKILTSRDAATGCWIREYTSFYLCVKWCFMVMRTFKKEGLNLPWFQMRAYQELQKNNKIRMECT